jgi:hypothetical protein
MIDAATLINLGNVLFFIAAFPQIITAYRNRKKLSGLSLGLLLGYSSGTVFFAIGNYIIGATIATGLCSVSMAFYAMQLYWKFKCMRDKK